MIDLLETWPAIAEASDSTRAARFTAPSSLVRTVLWFTGTGTPGLKRALPVRLVSSDHHPFGLPDGWLRYPLNPNEIDSPVALFSIVQRVAFRRAMLTTLLCEAGVLSVTWGQASRYWPWFVETGILLPLSTLSVFSMYGEWLVIRLSLVLKDRLPFNALAFFEDAHARGILRHSGANYQFRHDLLQTRLAGTKLAQGFLYDRRQSTREVYSSIWRKT
jgi:hypothetical protein